MPRRSPPIRRSPRLRRARGARFPSPAVTDRATAPRVRLSPAVPEPRCAAHCGSWDFPLAVLDHGLFHGALIEVAVQADEDAPLGTVALELDLTHARRLVKQ